jgi:hypothetical protein
VLLAVAIVAVLALLAESTVVAGQGLRNRQRRHADRRRRLADRRQRLAAREARIIVADHERLIVTYSPADDTIYVLSPPGADSRAVLRAARLVLSEDKYQELARYLGWPAE